MSVKPPTGKGSRTDQERNQRLKAALKANLARRKTQARARGEPEVVREAGKDRENE